MKSDIGEPEVLPLGRSVTLAGIGPLHQALCRHISEQRPLALDMAAVEQVDLSFVQLLVSASKSFAASGLSFSPGPMPAAVAKAFERAGLDGVNATRSPA